MIVVLVSERDAAAQGTQPDQQWVNLGPPGAPSISILAVSEDWPSDPFLYALQRQSGDDQAAEAVRSIDGGTSWESLGLAPEGLSQPIVVASNRLGRVMFALTDRGQLSDRQLVSRALIRSVDGGMTWTTLLDVTVDTDQRDARSAIRLSPTFRTDEGIFVIIQGRLYRSFDAGDTLESLDPSSGRRVRDVAISSAFDTDRTLFATATNGSFAAYIADAQGRQAQRDAVNGDADLVISTDAGITWVSRAAGLVLDGQPFRHVESLAVSPTYPQDGVIFAFAWGLTPAGLTPSSEIRSVLFRSRNSGGTWEFVWEPFPLSRDTGNMLFQASLAMSPAFATNGVAVMTSQGHNAGPHGSPCRVLASRDGGATWSVRRTNGESVYCGVPRIGGDNGLTATWLQNGPSGETSWNWSTDAGMTLQRATPPGSRSGSTETRNPFPRAMVTNDGTMFFGNQQGVWALGPSARPAGGGSP
ncbi:MAG: exo-alpha-sialidase [Chloroflexi bacterium]|nr:exo-alpha-sialidase [Chloroflexota bacterium]